MEDDQGVMVAKVREKGSFKGWLAKMFNENSADSLDTVSHPSLRFSTNPNSPNSQNQWESCVQEIENYFQHLLSLKLDEEEDCGQGNDRVQISPMELARPEHADSNMVTVS